MKLLPTLFAAASLIVPAHAALVEKAVKYQQGDAKLEGFHVYDDAATGKRPAVLVIHQWTGLTDYEKERSRMLAGLGYNVFALDIYGEGVRPKPPEAGQEAGKYKSDRKLFRERLVAGLDVLRAEEHTDPARIAAIGYCFGGGGALELARAGVDIAGVVSFHGSLDAAPGMEAKEGEVKAKILVLHGALDPHAPTKDVEALGEELHAAKANWQINLYGDAVHSFTQKSAGDDPSKGSAYNAQADQRSWAAMRMFFTELFK